MIGSNVILLNWGNDPEVHAVITGVRGHNKVSVSAFPPMQSNKLIDNVPYFDTKDEAVSWCESQAVPKQHVVFKAPAAVLEAAPVGDAETSSVEDAESELARLLTGEALTEEQYAASYGMTVDQLPRNADGSIDGSKMPVIHGKAHLTLPDVSSDRMSSGWHKDMRDDVDMTPQTDTSKTVVNPVATVDAVTSAPAPMAPKGGEVPNTDNSTEIEHGPGGSKAEAKTASTSKPAASNRKRGKR